MINKIILFFIGALILSCSSHHEHEEMKVLEVTEFASDISIPKSFIQQIESDLLLESKILSPVYLFIPLKVQFTEKSHGTLLSHAFQVAFPKSGGHIDLQSVVTGQGSFYFSFPAEQFKELPELEHLFYMSQSPIVKIDGEDFGLGCGKWVDLKKQFANLQKPNFLRVNTTLNRHLHVMAGSYIFVFRKLNQIYLTQVTITDSKNKNQLCPDLSGVSS